MIPTALNNQGFWAKLLIFAAGAAMNFIAGLLIILVLYADAQAFYVPVMAGFADGCPLESDDGLQEGDRLLRIDGEKVYVYSDISLLMGLNKTGAFDLQIERNGEVITLRDFTMERREYTDQNGKAYTGYGLYFGAEEATLGRKLSYSLEQRHGLCATGAAEPADAGDRSGGGQGSQRAGGHRVHHDPRWANRRPPPGRRWRTSPIWRR